MPFFTQNEVIDEFHISRKVCYKPIDCLNTNSTNCFSSLDSSGNPVWVCKSPPEHRYRAHSKSYACFQQSDCPMGEYCNREHGMCFPITKEYDPCQVSSLHNFCPKNGHCDKTLQRCVRNDYVFDPNLSCDSSNKCPLNQYCLKSNSTSPGKCVPRLEPYSLCVSDDECRQGYGCDIHLSRTCLPLCLTDLDCVSSQYCLASPNQVGYCIERKSLESKTPEKNESTCSWILCFSLCIIIIALFVLGTLYWIRKKKSSQQEALLKRLREKDLECAPWTSEVTYPIKSTTSVSYLSS